METHDGIAVDATVIIDGDCEIEYEVSANTIEIKCGHRTGSLFLGMSEAAVTRLMMIETAALEEMRQLRAGTHERSRPRGTAEIR